MRSVSSEFFRKGTPFREVQGHSYPRCAECMDYMIISYLPTWKVKNGHMNKGKWFGNYSHPMEHLGTVDDAEIQRTTKNPIKGSWNMEWSAQNFNNSLNLNVSAILGKIPLLNHDPLGEFPTGRKLVTMKFVQKKSFDSHVAGDRRSSEPSTVSSRKSNIFRFHSSNFEGVFRVSISFHANASWFLDAHHHYTLEN